jgi:hypothetical protein
MDPVKCGTTPGKGVPRDPKTKTASYEKDQACLQNCPGIPALWEAKKESED